jgi:hypothetical protein
MKRILLMSMIVLQAAGFGAFAGDPSHSPTERFHVAVLAASRKDGPVPALPPGEAKALADFQKVMSYKSFNVEAETLLQSDRGAEARLGTYKVQLIMDNDRKTGDTIDVHAFSLRAAEAKPALNNTTVIDTYIETSFTIKRGETIVLGTSTTDQQARVVLVTALP